MDTLTHALTGAAISDCWFRRRLGPVSTPFALLVTALPDVDIFTYLMSSESAWTHHRGYTHSFFPMLVAAPLFGYIGYRLSKRQGSWGLWSLLAVLCLFSHTIIDLVTSWGTMPLLPFSNARISWDVAPVLDLFVLALTASSFVANRILRWERVDYFINPLAFPVVHRHPHRQRAADLVAKVVVALVVLYLLVGWQQNRQTVRIAREELTRHGITPVEVRAFPVMFTYIAWEIAARDADGAIYNAAYSSYAPEPMRFVKHTTLPAAEVGELLSTPLGSMFAWYTQGMYVARRITMDGESRLVMEDRRFFGLDDAARSRFVMEFPEGADGSVDSGRVVRVQLTWDEARAEAERLWELTWGGHVTSTVAQGAGDAITDGDTKSE